MGRNVDPGYWSRLPASFVAKQYEGRQGSEYWWAEMLTLDVGHVCLLAIKLSSMRVGRRSQSWKAEWLTLDFGHVCLSVKLTV